jgi:hypothetical protein
MRIRQIEDVWEEDTEKVSGLNGEENVTGSLRKLHNEELPNVYCSLNIIQITN